VLASLASKAAGGKCERGAGDAQAASGESFLSVAVQVAVSPNRLALSCGQNKSKKRRKKKTQEPAEPNCSDVIQHRV